MSCLKFVLHAVAPIYTFRQTFSVNIVLQICEYSINKCTLLHSRNAQMVGVIRSADIMGNAELLRTVHSIRRIVH